MKEATLLKADGTETQITPADDKRFTLKELQAYVGGLVQWVPLPSGKVMVCNDEGKLIGLPENPKAIEFWKKEYPIEKYPLNNDELVVGDVIIASKNIV